MYKQCLMVVGLAISGVLMAQEPVDLNMVNQIRQESFHRSQVMDTLGHLTDRIGPRLTNSPQMREANAWTRSKFTEWGLANVHDEAFDDFGRGWEFTNASVLMLGPHPVPLRALPLAWTPGTNGPVEGEVMAVKIKKVADLDQYKGKLAGKILLLDEARPYKRGDTPDSRRYTEDGLEAMRTFELPTAEEKKKADERLKSYSERTELTKATNEFFAAEGVLATLNISAWDNGILRVGAGGSRRAGESVGVLALVMVAERYNQLARLVEAKQPVKLRVDVQARFTDDANQPGYNTVAEIPGTGRDAREVVMLGAHMDSWHTGTGASDNGAGVAVMMEAMRILKAVGAKPHRTIRIALWSGEEQGLIGSRAYVAKHFAKYPEPTDPEQKALPEFLRKPTGKLQTTPEYERLAAYFNVDNGSGRLRGIYAQENAAVVPIFKAWLEPFHDVGATTVVLRNTGSTDHISFDRVGLPGFQFIQDPLDYSSNVHHSDLDTLDHAEPEDLKQAAAIVASFVYAAAMRENMLPRKPLLEE
jgi:hypothetical protein